MLNFSASLSAITHRAFSLPVVVLYVTEGCNFHCISCSYRSPLVDELSVNEIRALADKLFGLGLRHIAYSGGEPLMRRDFPDICRIFTRDGINQTLLTNGLLLEKRYDDISHSLKEIIVSIDGATAETHDFIRGTRSFDQILKGIEKAASNTQHGPRLSMRTVLQKGNFRELPAMIRLARSIGMSRISFLTADVLSDAFGREMRGEATTPDQINLNHEETIEFRALMKSLISDSPEVFASGFVSQSPGKMMHLVEYYEAQNGDRAYPRNVCNAPMVSAVITSTGNVQPCFFLPSFGNIRTHELGDLLRGSVLRQTKTNVRDYALAQCHTCVCTSYVSPINALFDRF